MRLFYLIFLILISFTSCKSSKRAISNKTETSTKTSSRIDDSYYAKANRIITYAKAYEGTKYKYGGTNHDGLDCSGLVYLAFKEEGIQIPRVSYIIAEEGKRISLKKVVKGDLLFFKTTKSSKRINHVGLVVSTKSNIIEFIHSTSSKGVVTSSLLEPYWNKAFVEARRVLNLP